MSKLGDKDFENYIEEYKFTIRTQQQMIDELINKINKAIEEINYMITNADITEISAIKLKQILGDKENERN